MCTKYPHTAKDVYHKNYTQKPYCCFKRLPQSNFKSKDNAILEIFAAFYADLFSRKPNQLMYYNFKEKSWSVLLVKGYVRNNQVRAERCENCKSTTEVLAANYGNPNLLLYGCKDIKCKHRMLKLDFDADVSKKLPFEELPSAIICDNVPNLASVSSS